MNKLFGVGIDTKERNDGQQEHPSVVLSVALETQPAAAVQKPEILTHGLLPHLNWLLDSSDW